MLVWVHYKMQEKIKKKNRCGRDKVSFCFVSWLYVSGFNSISVSSATLTMWFGWKVGGRMSLTLLGLTDSNMISLCLSLHIVKACLILRKCFFSN